MIDNGSRTGRLVGLFLLGLALFNYPLLTLFNLPQQIWGIPLLYLYIFVAWAVFILLINTVTKIRRKTPSSETPTPADISDWLSPR